MDKNNDFKIVKSEVFHHAKFGNLRVITDDQDGYWFVGKVVAEAMGYTRPTDALRDHVEHGDTKLLIYKAYAKSPKASELWKGNDYSNKTLINESGLYSLVLGSKLPQARVFKHWVTSEVLPQIRKTGSYTQAQQENNSVMITTTTSAPVSNPKKRVKLEGELTTIGYSELLLQENPHLSVTVSNLPYFLECFATRRLNSEEHHYSPYKILADLEEQIREEFFKKQLFHTCLLVGRDDHCFCDVIFQLEDMYKVGDNEFEVVYWYDTTCS